MKLKLNSICWLISSILIGGCVNSRPLPSVIQSDNYSSDKEKNSQIIIPSTDKVLTINEAVKTGLRNNPTYEMMEVALLKAHNSFYNSLTQYSPKISTTGKFYGQQGTGGESGWKGEAEPKATLMLFNGMQRELAVFNANINIKKTEEEKKDARRILVNAIIDMYYNLVMMDRVIEIWTEDCNFQEEMLTIEEEKVRQNLKGVEDTYNFRFLLEYSRSRRISVELLRKVGGYAFAALLGLTNAELPDDLELISLKEITSRYKVDVAPFTIDHYLDLAIEQRPDLKARKLELRMMKNNYYAAWGKFSPVINAEVSYKWENSQWASQKQTLKYGLNATWELWSGGSRIFGIRDAEYNVQQVELAIMAKWIEVVSQVRIAYATLQTAVMNLDILTKATNYAIKQRDIAKSLFEVSKADVVRLNQAQVYLVRAQGDRANAEAEVYKAKANLQKAIGAEYDLSSDITGM